MIAKKIPDVKDFMNQLLLKDTFDSLLICEATLRTATILSISGKLNMDFFDTEEKEKLKDTSYATWATLKPLMFQAVKGSKVPSSFKIVFMLSKRNQDVFIQKYNLPLSDADIAGLYLNVYYDEGNLSITSGTALRIFTLDKRLEQIWDDSLLQFFTEHHIYLEEL